MARYIEMHPANPRRRAIIQVAGIVRGAGDRLPDGVLLPPAGPATSPQVNAAAALSILGLGPRCRPVPGGGTGNLCSLSADVDVQAHYGAVDDESAGAERSTGGEAGGQAVGDLLLGG